MGSCYVADTSSQMCSTTSPSRIGLAVAKKRAAALVKKLRWTKPWFMVAAINGSGTQELGYAVMEFLEAAKSRRK